MTYNIIVKDNYLSLNKEVCRHLWRSCANDSSRKGLFQRQPPKASDPGIWVATGEVMSLGDKQGDQNAIGDWRNDQKIGERGH